MAGILPTANSLPPEAQAVLKDLDSSNQERLALLERRFTVPPSPAPSAERGGGGGVAGAIRDASLLGARQNSAHSCHSVRSSQRPPRGLAGGPREATPSVGQVAETVATGGGGGVAGGHSQDGMEMSSAPPPTKRRRTATGVDDGGRAGVLRQPSARPGDSRGTSPPSQLGGAGGQQKLSPFLTSQGEAAGGGGTQRGQSTPGSKQKQQNTIGRYFPQLGGVGGDGGGAAPARRAGSTNPSPPPALQLTPSAATTEAAVLREENTRLGAELAAVQAERGELSCQLAHAQAEAAEARAAADRRDAEARAVLVRLAVANARHEREATARRLAQLAPRLGGLAQRRQGIEMRAVWEDGEAHRELAGRLRELAEQREAIEAARKAAKRRLPLPGQPLPAAGGGGGEGALHPDDWVVQEEIFKARLAALKREEEGVRQEAARLEAEKVAYMRDVKLAQDQAASRFSAFPVLNGRFVLLNLLGRGGFSEVFKALDLATLREVACKIHGLDQSWSEAKKASYVKHSIREYHIHKVLRHPRIVSLIDIFEIDNNTFATVLELCTGGDLDTYLKQHETLGEKEAKSIIAQVLSGLAYLNTKHAIEDAQRAGGGYAARELTHSVIHYDLKPANILFTALGEVKITDFGLSKVVGDGQTQGLELTSQGAGTYWYLPPECFVVGQHGAAPMISNKVDVWSCGVILYQMLFGRRPFGHEQSQEQILRNEVMLNAREVAFPSRPAVSTECKDFIRRCLAYRQEERMDVAMAAAHPFLCFKRPARGAGGGGGKEAAAAAAAAAAASGQ